MLIISGSSLQYCICCLKNVLKLLIISRIVYFE